MSKENLKSLCFHGYIGLNHSWSVVQRGLASAFLKNGHQISLCSTNGIDCIPDNLKPYLTDNLNGKYDIQLSYTAMQNFSKYLSHGGLRYAIYNYEFSILPDGWAKHHNDCDLILPSSNFSKEIFLNNKIPENKMVVIPHGVNVEDFETKEKYPLKTSKALKILACIAQPHIRKAIPELLDAFGKAFTKKDDVCLVAKVVINNGKRSPFEVHFPDLLKDFYAKYKDHAEIEVITEFIPNMAVLYNACDILFAIPHSECFHLPSLEACFANKIVISSRYGGPLDFLTDECSLLVNGKEGRVPREAQYWGCSPYSKYFYPDISDAVDKLRYAVENYDLLIEKFKPGIQNIIENYTWDKAAEKILELCK